MFAFNFKNLIIANSFYITVSYSSKSNKTAVKSPQFLFILIRLKHISAFIKVFDCRQYRKEYCDIHK